MTLPKIGNPIRTVEIDGEEFQLRALTRAEVALFNKQVSEDRWTMADTEIAAIAAATDTPKEDTAAWYETTPSHVVDMLVSAIREMSRIDEGAQKSG